MSEEMIDMTLEHFYEEEREARNAALEARLSDVKSFEDMLFELASLRGLNVAEREHAAAHLGMRDKALCIA